MSEKPALGFFVTAFLCLALLLPVASIASGPDKPDEPAKADFTKTLGEITIDADGVYFVDVTLLAVNVGTEELTRLQLKDDLNIFGSEAVVSVSGVSVVDGDLTLNSGYDGTSDISLLTGDDSLAVGERAEVTFTIGFELGTKPGPFKNCALLWAKGKESGTNIDVDACARIEIPLDLSADFQKTISNVIAENDGSYSAIVTLDTNNTGPEDLLDLQLKDRLDIFGAGRVLAVDQVVVLLGQAVLNPRYDGVNDIGLLAGTDTLVRGDRLQVQFRVSFDPRGETGPFENCALMWAAGSATGRNIDIASCANIELPGDPPPPPGAAIEIQKSAGEVSDNGDGTLSVPIDISVVNTGDEALVSLQIEEDLDIFGAGQLVAIEDLAATGLTLNPNYDGLADIDLLTGGDALAQGDSASVSFVLVFAPGTETGPFTNTVTVSAVGDGSGETVTHTDTATFAGFVTEPNAAIDVTKTAGVVTDNGDGTLSVPIDILIANTGNQSLVDIQVEEDLDIFGAGQLVTIEGLTASGLTLNPNYDGLVDTDLLTGDDSLGAGETATVSLVVRFDPGTETGPFTNSVTASATGADSGDPVTDTDTATFPGFVTEPNAAVEIDKTAGVVSDNGDGTLSVPIDITISNVGNQTLVDVQIADDLDIFAAGQLVAIEGLAAPGLTLNPNYDGLTDINLLAGDDVLALGQSATISFVLRFDPGIEPGPFTNSATASATGADGGDPVTDTDTATFPGFVTEPNAALVVTKTAGEVSDNGDGTLSVPIDILIANTGDQSLTNIQIQEDLDIFGAGELVAIEDLAAPGLSLNPAFDGLANINLLTGDDVLAQGESATVSFVLRFNPLTELGPFTNTATASASGADSGETVTDTDTATFPGFVFEPNAALVVTKTAGEVSDNGDGTLSVPISIAVANTGDQLLLDLQIEDSLDLFGAGAVVAVENTVATGVTLNPNYDGVSDINLLAGSDGLAPGASGSVSFVLRFDPGTETGPFTNSATASATGADSGDLVTSTDTATFPGFVAEPSAAVDISKVAGGVSDNGDGTLSVPIEITVSNIGDQSLLGVQIEEDLDIFGDGELVAVESLAAPGLTLNPNFDGLTDINLLTGDDVLDQGESVAVSFVLRFNPLNEAGPFTNTATASASGENSGETVTDTDTATFPGFVGEPNAAIEIDKVAGTVTENGDGTLSVPIDITVTNSGNQSLAGIQVVDSLDIFGAGQLIAVEGLNAPGLTVNPGYDGLIDVDMLTGDDVLGQGAAATVSFVLRFDPGSEAGPFTNTATATAAGADSGATVSATDSATFPGSASQPNAAVVIDKTAADVTDNGDGTLSVPIEILLTNTGNQTLVDIQIVEDLDIFGVGQLVAIEDLSAPGLSVNAAFNGLSDTNLLAGDDVLAVGNSATLTFVLRFDAAGELGPFTNVATVTATGEQSGAAVSDSDSATFLGLPSESAPAIVLQKSAEDAVPGADGTYTSAMQIVIANPGNETLLNLQIEDSLAIFGAGQVLAVESLQSNDLSINPDYDGLRNTALLLGSNQLASREVASLRFSVRFDPASEAGPFTNSASVSATSEETSTPVSATGDATFELDGTTNPTPDAILVSKTADRRQVMRGEAVAFEIKISNLTDNLISDVAITDNPPVGFQLVEDSTVLVRAGADQILYTADDVVASLSTVGTRPVVFDTFELGGKERVAIRYLMKVSVGIVDGEYVNSVTVSPDPFGLVTTTAKVTVFGDPIFEQSTLIGKVFDDRNGDLVQGPGEPGVPGVRLATVAGLTVETDAQGRYHLADVSVDRFDRGANFIIKIDTASLPTHTEILSQNPRVVRLTQATMSRVNFAVRLPEDVANNGEPEDCAAFVEGTLDVLSNGDDMALALLCDSLNTTLRKADAQEITVSGGEFGCDTLVTRTLPGRLGDEHSEVIVYAGEHAKKYKKGHVCVAGTAANPEIRVGHYPLELKTKNGTKLWINGAGDVVRGQDPENDEHIIVMPFRDDSASTEITALRVVNDGGAPGKTEAAAADSEDLAPSRVTTRADMLVIDPRLDILAMNHAVVDAHGNLVEPVEFATYTNYSAFIGGYQIDVFGRYTDSPKTVLLEQQSYSGYQFEVRRKFDYQGGDLHKFAELEYRLSASNCSFPADDKDCVIDRTSTRILNLRSATVPGIAHEDSEIWGQSSLELQNIHIRGGRVRKSGTVEPGTDHVIVADRHVPVGRDGSFVLEQYVPTVNRQTQGAEEAVVKPKIIPADANDIRVRGGLFGCGGIAAGRLPGRIKNDASTITATTVPARHEIGDRDAIACPPRDDNLCPPDVKPGEIEITTSDGSCFRITAAGDVVPKRHPSPDVNRQQLVITPFRDDTDSTVVSALRITNEGSPAAAKTDDAAVSIGGELAGNDYWFAVALANISVGQNNVSGNKELLALDEHFDGSTYTDGRIAFYAKGRVDEKYLITAQLDTTEDQLKDFSDNLKRKDPRRIFRQLDPNRYFPTYGDDSITITDVDTQGAFYARVDWDKNMALWGNYNTGITDTEFGQYNRSLYGLKLKHESSKATEFGETRSRLTLFGSEAQSAAAHITFRATGGSLYYLRDTDIVQGSEKIWVEVRRRDSEQVVEKMILLAGRDYEIDAIQGRIILRQPLSQVVNDRQRAIVRSSPLEGDEVFLLVDYEYVPDAFTADALTYGGRGQLWLNDHLAIGATSVVDERDGADYKLRGLDVTLQRSEKTYLRAELADSSARQNNTNFTSANGGLSFRSQSGAGSGASMDGNAVAIEARVDLADIGDGLEGDVMLWSKTRDAEFSTGRLGEGVDVNDRGVELHTTLGDKLKVTASHSDLEREQLSRERVSRMQLDGGFDKVTVGFEVRHEDVEMQGVATPQSALSGRVGSGEALLIGARVGYDLSPASSVYVSGQAVTDEQGIYEENDLLTVGLNTRLQEDIGVSLEASDGDRGSALIAGVDFASADGLNFNLSGGVGSGAINQFATRYAIGEGHELYGSYAIDPDRTDTSRNLLTFGQRRAFGNGIGLFTESQFGKDDRYASVGHVFGLDFEGNDDWRFNATMQFSENEDLNERFDRNALSFGAYRNAGDLKLSTRLEFREDQGATVHNKQYVSTSSFARKLSDSRRWIGQLNVSWTDDELNGGKDARFVELDIGHAYRSVYSDRLNMIARYSFLFDLPTEGQDTIRPDERSHLLSIEGIFDFENKWEIAAKAAIRKGERRSIRDQGPWQDFGLRMLSARARYQVNKSWDGVAEYRWISDIDGDNERHGALLTLYRVVGEKFKVGVGFNFTDFNDTLRIDDYDNRGWFIDLIGAY